MGKEVLMQAFLARVCVKRASREIEEYRRDSYNGYVAGCREYPCDLMEASRQMMYYRPMRLGKEAKYQRRISKDCAGRGGRHNSRTGIRFEHVTGVADAMFSSQTFKPPLCSNR